MDSSELFDQSTFYKQFIADINHATSLVIIESAYLTERRIKALLPAIESAIQRGARVVVNTRFPESNTEHMFLQSSLGISLLQDTGVKVLLTVNHHRKLVIIDDQVLWEGSMNVLSNSDSCEIMRRIDSRLEVNRMKSFLRLSQWYSEE